jgi:hypothetical protein
MWIIILKFTANSNFSLLWTPKDKTRRNCQICRHQNTISLNSYRLKQGNQSQFKYFEHIISRVLDVSESFILACPWYHGITGKAAVLGYFILHYHGKYKLRCKNKTVAFITYLKGIPNKAYMSYK